MYVLYSDESHITDLRYESISTISLPVDKVSELTTIINNKLIESDVDEFKWKWVDSAKYRFAGIKLIDIAINWITTNFRIDTIIWDNQDSRHAIRGRDDIANLGRMYYHLLRNVMCRRRPGLAYDLRPDEQVEVNWEKLKECLESAGNWQQVFISELLRILNIEFSFNISSFSQVKSCDEPICQLCDLFAGMAAYSCYSYEKLVQVERENSGQLMLLDPPAEISISGAERERLTCISHFLTQCNNKRLGVSIEKKRKLWTANPRNPINFWHYEPQGKYDKAPLHE